MSHHIQYMVYGEYDTAKGCIATRILRTNLYIITEFSITIRNIIWRL